MELQCGVCLLRTWRKSDAGPIARHANDREVWLNLRDLFPHPYNTAHAVAYIRSVTAQTPTRSFVIVVADEPVGGIALRLGEDIERYSASRSAIPPTGSSATTITKLLVGVCA